MKTSSVTLTLIGLAVQLWAGMWKSRFYIMYFSLCVRDVSELTCGSLNEMFTQIPRTPPHGHVIKGDSLLPVGVGSVGTAAGMCQSAVRMHRVASGLITTGNHCHSCEPWDKMIKMCPTFTFSSFFYPTPKKLLMKSSD